MKKDLRNLFLDLIFFIIFLTMFKLVADLALNDFIKSILSFILKGISMIFMVLFFINMLIVIKNSFKKIKNLL